MPHPPTASLDVFARHIASGCPPVLAAKQAGYRNMRAGRAAARVGELRRFAEPEVVDSPPPAVAAPKKSRLARVAAPEAKAAQTAPSPPAEPELTEAEWLARFGPLLRGETGGSGARA